MEKLTVMGIGAHADPFDMAFLCGGTLAKYSKNGHRVVMASVCGENQAEGDRVAAALGAETRYLDYRGGTIIIDIELAHKIVDMIREVKPDIIITLQPTCFTQDHRMVSAATLNACLKARLDRVKTEHPPFKVGCVYYCDGTAGLNCEVSVWVDISDTIEIKVNALREHRSLARDTGIISFEAIEHVIERERNWAASRGNQVEVEYAEAFQPVVHYRIMRAFEFLPGPGIPPRV